MLFRGIDEGRTETCPTKVDHGNALLSRIGDEFIAITEQDPLPASAKLLAQRLHRSLDQDIETDGHSFKPALSIGIAIDPQDGDDARLLFANAMGRSIVRNTRAFPRDGSRAPLALPETQGRPRSWIDVSSWRYAAYGPDVAALSTAQDQPGIPNYHGTFFNFCSRKSENTLIFGARCLLLL